MHPTRDAVDDARGEDQTTRYARPESVRPPPSSKAPVSHERRDEQQREQLAPRRLERSQERVATLQAAYLCDHPDDIAMIYEAARFWFEAMHWDEAVVLFERVAFGPPASTVAPDAAMLYLESLNVLGSHFGRTECHDDLEVNVFKLRDWLCTPALLAGRENTCLKLAKIEVDILRRPEVQ